MKVRVLMVILRHSKRYAIMNNDPSVGNPNLPYDTPYQIAVLVLFGDSVAQGGLFLCCNGIYELQP
jgi:hypothetical protein